MTRQCSRVFCIGRAILYVGRLDLPGPWASHPAVLILSVTHTMQGLWYIEARNTCSMCHDREKGRARAWLLLTVSDGISWPSGRVAAENSVNIFSPSELFRHILISPNGLIRVKYKLGVKQLFPNNQWEAGRRSACWFFFFFFCF